MVTGAGPFRPPDARPTHPPPAAAGRTVSDTPISGFRKITDQQGNAWSVWEVLPKGRPRRDAVIGGQLPPLPAELQSGWLTFQSDTERRRLSPAPDGWHELPDGSLLALLAQARRERGAR